MEEIKLACWEKFEERISSLSNELEDLKKSKNGLKVSSPLFRGQAAASWTLEDTLHRVTQHDTSREAYFRTIRTVRPVVVTMTGKEWTVPQDFDGEKHQPPQGYEFMIYLRHHGFPSPLLDWTRSHFVAAYFAFRSSEEPEVAIYSYVEWLGEGKSSTSTQPTMNGWGPYVVSDKRHYAQQCEYTTCTKQVSGESVYTSHQSATSRNDSGQDRLTKYILPASERKKVLRKLELMNVTAFSLFGTEESLMEMLAYQEIEKRIE